MPLAALTYVYCSQGDVEAVLSSEGLSLSLNDDNSGNVDPVELAYLNDKLIPWVSSRINVYLLGLYDAADLATSMVVNDIAAIWVARRARMRRGNPAPKSLTELYEENLEMLKAIKAEEMSLEDIPLRTSNAIAWSNIRHSRHLLRRTRVERTISEQTPAQRPQTIDLAAEYYGPELYWL